MQRMPNPICGIQVDKLRLVRLFCISIICLVQFWFWIHAKRGFQAGIWEYKIPMENGNRSSIQSFGKLSLDQYKLIVGKHRSES